MPPLVKIRSERDQMSAIERRIADFILDNAHLLRDYSSQQLASALGISQSSVVKFAQKCGFKGYPDLKYSIGAAVARNGGGDEEQQPASVEDDDALHVIETLRRAKLESEEETGLLNPTPVLEHIAATLATAERIFVCGLGEDGLVAREFALKLSLLGLLTVQHADPVLMMANLATVGPRDVLLLFSEHGELPQLSQISRLFQDDGGRVVSVTRHTANPLRAHADASLAVSAHHAMPHIEQMLYRASVQYLLDVVFALLCHAYPERRGQLDINLERMHHMIHS
ncbi:MurR/RpiR family transcriptional regulator [Pseudoxanthomonas dokdonensis]|uniref:Transcriptional regulator n=1 Tax=Pseudoxanthomonas dokdonensis TaxID=344882 RepID=A0A0R0D1M7_9GAMM|nr:MurR/RpiR family transcriptional regulator [Pseudoxanthomonas dokdonensis]KRG71969.1 transcriptional regulator [Pseudoxanthomonas dokdonensis]